jgi:hypothetical protein
MDTRGHGNPELVQREVTLSSLRFDHAEGPDAASALHLRRDNKSTVSRPEWVAGSTAYADSPVLYAADFHNADSVVVKARFSKPSFAPFLAKSASPMKIRALEGGVLGRLEPFSLDFGEKTELTVEVPLTHLELHGSSKTDVSWRWEYRVGQDDWRFLANTYHRVYCTPRRPNEPWDMSARNLVANPWTAALDIACQVPNHSGVNSDMDAIAAGLCELLNPGGLAPNPFRLAYSINTPGTPYYGEAGKPLELSALLERAGGGAGNGALVNCDDCAGLVVALANLLGCELYEQEIRTVAMHPVMPLGEGRWWAYWLGFVASSGPVGEGILTYHRVAWRGINENDARVFDICWLLNSLGNPDDPEQPHPELRAPWYPYGERFKVAGGLDYIGRLHPVNQWSLGLKTRRGIR